MQDSKLLECKWINFVKNTLFNLGLGYVWDNPNVSPKWLIAIVKLRLIDAFKQKWYSDIYANDTCINYRIFKSDLSIEEYLIKLPFKQRQLLCKFRCRNFNVPFGIFSDHIIPTTCPLCDKSDIPDEFHLLLDCAFFRYERNKVIPGIVANTYNLNKILKEKYHKLHGLIKMIIMLSKAY